MSKDFVLTKGEQNVVRDLLENYFLRFIREDEDIDSMLYVYNAMNLFKRLGGLNMYSDYKED